MSWIQENKFTASVLGATVVVAGALFYLGNSARSEAEELRENSNAIVAETNSIKAKKPFPTQANKQLVESKVADFTKDALAFQQDLLKFRPAKMPKVSSSDFGNNVSEHIKSLKELYRSSAIALPDDRELAFGMERYRGKMASAEATRILNYQRKALHWLFTELAEAKPASLDNVFRARVKEELNLPKATGRKKRTAKRKSSAVESVYRAFPVEITFTGSEYTLKQFLASLSNSDEYFFITRGIRIRNEKQESPNLKDAEFAKPSNDFSGGFEGLEGLDAEATPSESKGDPVLKQVTGDEKISVHLRLDLVLFKDATEVTFPRAKRMKKAKKKQASVKSSISNK